MPRLTKIEAIKRQAQHGPVICGAEIKKQLNGGSIFVIFEGKEQDIIGAFDTLWTANAYSGELEWLNVCCAVTKTTEAKFKRGLFNREIFHLMDDPKVCSANKKHPGGFAQLARETGEKLYAQMPAVYVLKPTEQYTPATYGFGDNSKPDSDPSGRD